MWKRTEAEARAGVMKKESPGAGAGAMFMKRIAPDAELCLRMSFLRRLRGPGFNTQRHLMWEPLSCWVRRSSRMRTTFLWLVVVTRAVEPKLKFQAPAPGIYIFWLLLQYIEVLAPATERFGPLKTHNDCIICTTRLPNKLLLRNWNPNSRLRLQPLKVFGSGYSHPHFAWAPAPQPWLKQTSFV